MDIQKIPAIQQKRIVTFVNHFIIDTVAHLNNLITSSENALWRLEKKMRKLEMTLRLLEIKLNFIPELEERNANEANCAATSQLKLSESESKIENVTSTETNELENFKDTDVNETGNTSTFPKEIQKYFKMVQVGVPLQAVKLKMQCEGFDPNLLN